MLYSGDGALSRLTRSLWGSTHAAPAVVDIQPAPLLGRSAVAALYGDGSLRFWDTAAAAPVAAVPDVMALAPAQQRAPPGSKLERLRCLDAGNALVSHV